MPVDLDARVVSNTRLSEEYNIVALEAAEVAARAQPGQFVMVKAGRSHTPFLRRPFSIFEITRAPSGEITGFTLLNKRIGTGTSMIFDLEPGDDVACLGPLGRPFPPGAPAGQAWMVAGGVGLAPFATLAASLGLLRVPMTLFYGGRRSADICCLHLFEAWGVHLVLTTEDGSRGEAGLVTTPLARSLHALPAGSSVLIYACGPTPMMRAVASLGEAYGRPCYVSLEPVMACGLGGCYSCVVPVRDHGHTSHHVRSCLEGPIFDAAQVDWERLQH